jgi:hypothetical protein
MQKATPKNIPVVAGVSSCHMRLPSGGNSWRHSKRSKMSRMRGRIIVVCRFIGAFKNAHKWANYRYVSSLSDEGNEADGHF